MSLAVYNKVATDGAGNAVAGAHVEIRLEVPGQPLAPLYSDRAGTAVLGNPFDTDANGKFTFFVVGGAYQVRVYTGASGAPTSEQIFRYEPIGLNAESDSIAQRTQRTVTASGVATIDADDADLVLIKKTVAAATRAVLPISSSRTKPVQIADRKYDANTNNITIVPNRPTTVTMTIASPCVVTATAHGRAVNDPVSFETTGALAADAAADTQYYVKTVPTADTLTFSATPGGAAINTSGSQSGVHTMGTDVIMGGASYTIDSNGGAIVLTPLADGTGWA